MWIASCESYLLAKDDSSYEYHPYQHVMDPPLQGNRTNPDLSSYTATHGKTDKNLLINGNKRNSGEDGNWTVLFECLNSISPFHFWFCNPPIRPKCKVRIQRSASRMMPPPSINFPSFDPLFLLVGHDMDIDLFSVMIIFSVIIKNNQGI